MLPNYQARSPFVLKHTTSLYIYVLMYLCHFVLDPRIFCVRSVFDPVPNFSDYYPYPPYNREVLK